MWTAPDPYLAKTEVEADLIAYGRDLIARTQDYFGENGLVRPASINGMNCQNCHLEAGSKPFGNNYFAVASTYPQMRVRSGALETIPKRINDCFQRSLNGEPLDTNSHEMKAMLAYMHWLGTGVPKGEKPKGAGLVGVPFLADIERVVGYSKVPLYRYFVVDNTIDTLILDALAWKVGTEIVLSNGFRFCPPRSTPNAEGLIPITEGYLFDMLPVDATVRTAKVTGAQLMTWLEKELNNVFAKDAAPTLLSQVSGVDYVFR